MSRRHMVCTGAAERSPACDVLAAPTGGERGARPMTCPSSLTSLPRRLLKYMNVNLKTTLLKIIFLNYMYLVEQHCPYFLPADRAPAYPTQYAGEPTFLCLDPRIPETGAQANKSNYGWDECCYWYCEGRLCYRCEARLSEAARPDAERCPPVEERGAGCAVPYQAAAAPRPRALLALLLLGLAAHARTHWTAATRLVKVRDSRL
uniref:Uncharacterized protein n=1 Tax=Heliothis virescens TaxID=7102 RepID=A0A2A4JET0_HELVI